MWLYWSGKDILEILFFFICFNRLSYWLSKDNNNLLFWFWGYFAILALSHSLGLQSILTLLLFLAPVVINVLFIIHQEIIQKNFIAPVKEISEETQKDWVSIVIKECLATTYQHKKVILLIETDFDISGYITNTIELRTFINSGVISLITQSNLYQQDLCIVIDKQGLIKGINTHVSFIPYAQTHDINSLKQIALASSKLNCLLAIASPKMHSFDMVIDGTIYQNKTAIQTKELIHYYIEYKKSAGKEKNREWHVSNKKSFNKQIEH